MTRAHLTRLRPLVPPAPREVTPATAPSSARTPSPPPASSIQADELLTPAAAAEKLSVTAKVLERWRGLGGGPAFIRLTSKTIRYHPADLAAFVAASTRASTAEQISPSP